MHGTPRKYWSRHDEDRITTFAASMRAVPRDADAWCVFDNTASGAAIENAWDLLVALAGTQPTNQEPDA